MSRPASRGHPPQSRSVWPTARWPRYLRPAGLIHQAAAVASSGVRPYVARSMRCQGTISTAPLTWRRAQLAHEVQSEQSPSKIKTAAAIGRTCFVAFTKGSFQDVAQRGIQGWVRELESL